MPPKRRHIKWSQGSCSLRKKCFDGSNLPGSSNARRLSSRWGLYETSVDLRDLVALLEEAAHGLGGLVYSIDQSNRRVTESVPTGWTAPSTDCWVLKKGGSC